MAGLPSTTCPLLNIVAKCLCGQVVNFLWTIASSFSPQIHLSSSSLGRPSSQRAFIICLGGNNESLGAGADALFCLSLSLSSSAWWVPGGVDVVGSVNLSSGWLLPCSTPNSPGPQKAQAAELPACIKPAPLCWVVLENGLQLFPWARAAVFLAALPAGTCHTLLLSDRLQAKLWRRGQLCRFHRPLMCRPSLGASRKCRISGPKLDSLCHREPFSQHSQAICVPISEAWLQSTGYFNPFIHSPFFWSGEIYSQVILHSKILPRLLTRPHHVMFFLLLTSSSCEIFLNVTTWGLFCQGLGILYA